MVKTVFSRKEALAYIYNDDHMAKDTLIEKIGEKYFNEFVTIGFLTTNMGTRYWLTDLGRQYCLEMFS